MQTITATEYWQGGHSLNTTDPLGHQDLALPDNVRIYYLAGTQHVIQATMPKGVCSGAPNTAIDPRPAMRALVLALDRWVKSGATPPASAYPKIADKTLVPAYALKWPQVAGLTVPRGPNPMLQFDYGKQYKAGLIDTVPPALLKARYVALVPAIDADGNEFELAPHEKNGTIALCRCGGSTTKPFCDGTHSRIGFQAAEKAVPGSAEG